MAWGTEEIEPGDELAEESEDGPAGLFGKGFKEDGDDTEGPLPEEIEEEGQGQESRGDGDADGPPEGQPLSGLHAERPGPGEKGLREEEKAQQQAVRHEVEDALDDDRAHGEARPQAFLAGQVQGLDQLAEAAGEDSADREADDVGRDEVPEADIDLLTGDEDVPAEGPGDEVKGRQRDEQQEKREADVGDLGGDLLPLDAAAEKIEENEHQDDDGNDFRQVPLHRRGPWYHEARRGSTASEGDILAWQSRRTLLLGYHIGPLGT